MSNEKPDYQTLSKRVGMLMYTGECSVFRQNEDPSIEPVHFLFDTITASNGMHQAILVDKDFSLMTNKVMLFEDSNEFFGFAKYMLRNGVNVTV